VGAGDISQPKASSNSQVQSAVQQQHSKSCESPVCATLDSATVHCAFEVAGLTTNRATPSRTIAITAAAFVAAAAAFCNLAAPTPFVRLLMMSAHQLYFEALMADTCKIPQ
jgi:hypothetical protein